MSSDETRRIVTGNRLRDGIPVYFAGEDRWSPDIDEAMHVEATAGERLLEAALAGPPAHPVVGPYLIDAIALGGAIHPVGLRERIRAFGPTVQPNRA